MSNATTPASIDTGRASAEDGPAAFLRGSRDAILAGLGRCARIPFIAAQLERAVDKERCAYGPAGTVREMGVPTEMICTGDAVAVMGSRRGDGSIDMDMVLQGAAVISHLRTELGRLPSRDGGDS